MKLDIVITGLNGKKIPIVVIRCSDTFVMLDSGYRNLLNIESPTSEKSAYRKDRIHLVANANSKYRHIGP